MEFYIQFNCPLEGPGKPNLVRFRPWLVFGDRPLEVQGLCAEASPRGAGSPQIGRDPTACSTTSSLELEREPKASGPEEVPGPTFALKLTGLSSDQAKTRRDALWCFSAKSFAGKEAKPKRDSNNAGGAAEPFHFPVPVLGISFSRKNFWSRWEMRLSGLKGHKPRRLSRAERLRTHWGSGGGECERTCAYFYVFVCTHTRTCISFIFSSENRRLFIYLHPASLPRGELAAHLFPCILTAVL